MLVEMGCDAWHEVEPCLVQHIIFDIGDVDDIWIKRVVL